MRLSDGDAASEAVPAEVKRPGVGGGPLGTISRLLTVLRLMYAPAPTPAFAPAPAAAPPPAHAPRPITQPLAVPPHNQPQLQYAAGGAVPSQAGGFFPSQGSAAVGTVHFGGAGSSVGGARGQAGVAAAGAGGPGQAHGQGMRAPAVPPPPRDNTGDYRLVVRRWIAHNGADRRKARSGAPRKGRRGGTGTHVA